LVAHAAHHRFSAAAEDALDLAGFDLFDGNLMLLVDAIALRLVANQDAKTLGVIVHPVVLHACCALNQGRAVGADDDLG
ncbi:MAG: hypothetical protein ACO3B8_09475, partial [Vulcanococcus sp.]